MPANITKTSFLRHFDGQQLHLDDLEPHLDSIKAQVARANVGIPARQQITPEQFLARLQQGAGEDGVIRREELESLFGLLDKLDTNGSSHSFAAFGIPGESQGAVRPSPASEVVGILSRVRRNPHAVELEKFKEVFSGGVIEASAIRQNPALRDVLVEAGLDMKQFDALVDEKGEISGSASLTSLFRLIDQLDSNDDGGSFDATSPVIEGEVGEATPAGMVLGTLIRAHLRYDQQFHQYIDLDRAIAATIDPATAKNARGRELQHRTQPDSDGCFRTCIKMLANFDPSLVRKVEHPSRSIRMTQVEDASGAIAGWKEDFGRGRNYIDACLDRGRPVIVGLSHANRGTNWRFDRATDHFVIIRARGVDDAGRLYYEFADPATSKANEKIGRFYVDSNSGMLFRPPMSKKRGSLYSRDWQVSQVRPYTDLSVEDMLAEAAAGRAVRTFVPSG